MRSRAASILSDQFALTVAGAKFDTAIELIARPVRDVGVLRQLLQGVESFLAFSKELIPPSDKFFSKVSALALIK